MYTYVYIYIYIYIQCGSLPLVCPVCVRERRPLSCSVFFKLLFLFLFIIFFYNVISLLICVFLFVFSKHTSLLACPLPSLCARTTSP